MDGSETNFSGWRGAVDEARKGFVADQMNLVRRLNKGAYKWRLWWDLQQPDSQFRGAFDKIGDAIFRHNWNLPTWSYIEPVADAQGDAEQLKNALTSPRRLHAARGKDWEEIAEESIEDNAFAIQKAQAQAAKLNAAFPESPPINWRDLIALPMPAGMTMAMQDPAAVAVQEDAANAEDAEAPAKPQARAKKKTQPRADNKGQWVTTEDGNRLYLEDGALSPSPKSPPIKTKPTAPSKKKEPAKQSTPNKQSSPNQSDSTQLKGGSSKGQTFSFGSASIDSKHTATDKAWVKNLPKAEAKALTSYTSSVATSGDIRKDSAKKNKSEQTKALLAALEKAEKHEGVVYRGVSTLGNPKFAEKLLSMKPGDTYTEKGLASTSANPSVAVAFTGGESDKESGILFRIKTKSGARVKEPSIYKHEEEVITKPGVKYRVVGNHSNAIVDGKRVRGVIELEEA
jgi:hypothetical protein